MYIGVGEQTSTDTTASHIVTLGARFSCKGDYWKEKREEASSGEQSQVFVSGRMHIK
jgi:hypothetical protein